MSSTRQYALAAFAASTEPLIAALRVVAERLEADAEAMRSVGRQERPFVERHTQLTALLPEAAPQAAANLLGTMLERGDLGELSGVVEHLEAMASGGPAARVAIVTTPLAMEQNERDTLARKLRAVHGEDLSLVFEIDAAILGGATVRIGDRVIDGSVASRLSALGESLLTPH